MVGTFYVPSTVHIYQFGQPSIKFRTPYATRTFNLPVDYYLTFLHTGKVFGYFLSFTHDKLHPTQLPKEVQHFSITHGFNRAEGGAVYTLYRSARNILLTSLGGGVVVTHPETRIRHMFFPQRHGFYFPTEGYFLSGITGALGLETLTHLYKVLYLHVAGKLEMAYVSIPVAAGFADLPVFDVKLQLGLVYGF